ncbi:hypothetical protein E2562_001805 [Oryza meyeriana var. granulata]|uniref:Uncharacterized protein n=1 Tax=Oryza meyeriana var. granulata TaxID=110450 RepID=A0A6G1CCE9_9ORYZ|nr:hypothetical protein E2562_001805 [Oryza meyeriana var. granulata]
MMQLQCELLMGNKLIKLASRHATAMAIDLVDEMRAVRPVQALLQLNEMYLLLLPLLVSSLSM